MRVGLALSLGLVWSLFQVGSAGVGAVQDWGLFRGVWGWLGFGWFGVGLRLV